MAVQSAHELQQLIHTLQQQFSTMHVQTCRDLHQQADQHIQHVIAEGEQWITNEIHTLNQEWQEHLNALRRLEQWFEHHTPLLGRIADDAGRLASEAFN